MAKQSIPVYDICTIDTRSGRDFLVERFGAYLEKHYADLHRSHRHSFYHLVLFTLGKGKHTIDFEQFKIRPYQIYFMIPGQVHSWHFEKGVDGYIIHFNEELFSSFLQNGHYLDRFPFFSGNSKDGVCQLPVNVHGHVISIFESILAEAKHMGAQNIEMICLKLLELFIIVDRSCSKEKQGKIPSQKLQLLKNFRQLIEKNYRNLRLPVEYAELLYITPNHLNALCQDLLGKTAGEMIRDRILLEAKRLLTNAGLTITEIAYELNFEDNSYFNRFFKRYTGQTPDAFRRSFIK